MQLIAIILETQVYMAPFRSIYVLISISLRERDTDKDGKLNFKEFFHGLFDLVRNYEEVGHNSSHGLDDTRDAPAKKLFAELDKDNDGYLLNLEVLSIN